METSRSESVVPPRDKLNLGRLFNLRRDQAEPQQIDDDVRAGVRVAGTNLWVLFFAILTASVGLNVNSTAVIIGAMLISPLMGPIIGIGYGAGINDFVLIRQAMRNLLTFTLVSLATSAIYFGLSPLNVAGSELLARTSPTIWDVLIAFFGGAAGVIALTRKSISNVVPGVAIATALMPPLCTAGFGLAHGRWDILAGALYLFVINGVFIATAALVIVKGLKLPSREQVSEAVLARTRHIIAIGLTVVLVPSIYLGWRLVQNEIFSQSARKIVSTLKADERYTIIESTPDPKERVLRLTVVGDRKDPTLAASAKALMEREGLKDTRLDIHYAGDARAEAASTDKREDPRDEYTRVLSQQLKEKDQRIKTLEEQVRSREAEEQKVSSLYAEVHAQAPQVDALTFAQGWQSAQGADKTPSTVVVLHTTRKLSREERTRLEKWLAVRLAVTDLLLMEQLKPTPTPRQKTGK